MGRVALAVSWGLANAGNFLSSFEVVIVTDMTVWSVFRSFLVNVH